MQQSLFQESENYKSGTGLTIKKNKAVLSKEQQSFNRLTARIRSLQEKINKDIQLLDELAACYSKKVVPEVVQLGKEKIKLSHLLHEKRKGEKLSGHLNEKLDELIFQLLDDAFAVVEPDEKDRELFAHYNGATYEEVREMQKDNMAEDFASMMSEAMGIDIDPEEFKKESPDFDKLDEQLNNKQQNSRKKTKKQLEKEEREKQKEEIKNKSLRGVYISLVKILHPDLETDANAKLEKEEYMKLVTAAYNKKDLAELVRLEVIWVKNHEESLQNTPVDVLKIYIQLLKDQVKDLEFQSQSVIHNPVYSNVADYYFFSRGSAFGKIEEDRNEYISMHTRFANAIQSLEKGNRNRSVIVQCIGDFYFEEDNDFGPDDDFDEISDSLFEDFFKEFGKKKW